MKTFYIATFAAALAFAGPALAQDIPAQTAVSTAGLDLGTAAGVRILDLRILHAASALCGTPSPADVNGRKAFDDCRRAAKASVASERGRALAQARSNGSVATASGQ